MGSLTITDAAYARIRLALDESPIESPIVSLVQSARATLPTYAELQGIDPHYGEGDSGNPASAQHEARVSSLPWKLLPGVYARDDFPAASRAEVRGIWFSFTPEWQRRLEGWLLDAVGDTLVLKDTTGRIVLPSGSDAEVGG